VLPAAADVAATAAGVSLAASAAPQRRPPGACDDEASFLALCTRCDLCIDACPHGAILKFTDKAKPALRNTPVMRPERRACEMCEGYPCAQACPEGALTVPAERLCRLGSVRIAAERCIAYMGPECGACVGICPDNVPGIRLLAWRPEVDSRTCVGCGRCIHACPTSPPAIEMVPL
jgi:MauM/NapG family ferredoxin protein